MKGPFLVVSRIAFFALVTSCSRPGVSSESPIPKIAVEKTQLANGLDVLTVEDHRLPRVSVSIWYHVGPVNEEPGRTGFAHLFEHMMFQKSKHVPENGYIRTLAESGNGSCPGIVFNKYSRDPIARFDRPEQKLRV